MHFEIIGEITNVEIIAVGSKIREVTRLRRMYGRGRWRKLKGVARIRLSNGRSGLPSFTDMKRTASVKGK